MNKKRIFVVIFLTMFVVLLLVGCRLKVDNVTIKCNEFTKKCEAIIDGDTEQPDDDSGSSSGGGSSEGGSSGDTSNADLLVYTALKYAGYTRNQFKPIAKQQGYTITDGTAWCAMFVSTIIKEAKITDLKKYTSASVSTFMSAMVRDNRFYHSKYWYNESKKFKDPIGPQVGDIVFFVQKTCAVKSYKGDGVLPSKSEDCFRHIGIVVKVTSSKITYVHGNTTKCGHGNGVCGNSTEGLGSAYIIGYGR